MKPVFKLLVLFITIISFSCNDGNQQGDASNGEASIEDSPSKTEKLNYLINNFNGISSSSYKAYDYYAASYGEDPDTFKEYKFYSPRGISESDVTKLDQLDKALEIDDFSELDPLIKDFKSKGKALSEVLSEVYEYYDMKDYEADNHAKGKELHKPLLSAFDDFFTVDEVLRAKTDSIQNIMEVAYLNELKEDGEELQYLVGISLNASKTMLGVSQAVDYEKLDAAQLEEASKTVRKYYDEMVKFKKDKPDEFKANHRMSWYLTSLKDYVIASNDLVSRVKSKKPFSTGEQMNLNNAGSSWMVKGSVPQLVYYYNKLVDNYNSMM